MKLALRSYLSSLVAWFKPGRFEWSSYANRSGTRRYKVYRPPSGMGARPLVVMLHGCSQNADDFALGTQMNELAERSGFIVAYPEQAVAANPQRCWNWFKASHQERDEGEPSLIAGITRDVLARYNADPKRVYVAGLSAGGAMAAIMGHTYPDLYAAVGIHSGLPYAAARDVPSALAAMRGLRATMDPRYRPKLFRTIPTIVFHGDLDTTVHARNASQAIAQARPTDDDGLKETVEKGEENGRRYTRTTEADAAGRLVVEHWLVHGAGHAWSGGSASGSYADPHGPDASRAMLAFFERFALAAPLASI